MKKGMVSADAVNISPRVKRAVVTVRGLLAGREFIVTRTRTASKCASSSCVTSYKAES